MSNTSLVVAIVKSQQKLSEIIASFILPELARVGNIVEELTALGNLKHDVFTSLLFSSISSHVVALSMLVLLDNIWMFKL